MSTQLGGDCDEFNSNFQYCEVDEPSLVGNGICNGHEYNTPECGYDGEWESGDENHFELYLNLMFLFCEGGDCEGGDECIVDYPSKIGDRECDGYPYNTAGCGFDGEHECDRF